MSTALRLRSATGNSYSHGLRSASTLGRLPKTAPRISGDFSLGPSWASPYGLLSQCKNTVHGVFVFAFFLFSEKERMVGCLRAKRLKTEFFEQKNDHKSRDFDTTLHVTQSPTFRAGGSPSAMLRDHGKPTHHNRRHIRLRSVTAGNKPPTLQTTRGGQRFKQHGFVARGTAQKIHLL
jgi:hypothetical protein